MIDFVACLGGRLEAAYPASRHDLEVRATGVSASDLSRVLAAEAKRVLEEHPDCRRIVFAPRASDLASVAAAETADFRFVVAVDLPTDDDGVESVSLMVLESPAVTGADQSLDVVPET